MEQIPAYYGLKGFKKSYDVIRGDNVEIQINNIPTKSGAPLAWTWNLRNWNDHDPKQGILTQYDTSDLATNSTTSLSINIGFPSTTYSLNSEHSFGVQFTDPDTGYITEAVQIKLVIAKDSVDENGTQLLDNGDPEALVRSTVLTGLNTSLTGNITALDSVLTAFGKAQNQLNSALTTESDPIFSAHASAGITSTNITNWNTAYSWGNHALAGYQPLITAGTTGQYYRGDKTWQTLDKTAVGLSNVDNTSDLNKPVSTATQTALDLKVDKLGNDKIVIIQTGQSNSVGTGGTYDSGEPADAVDARIFAWTGTKTNANGAWVQANLSGATMGDKVSNGQSMAFHAAKAILAEYPDKQVYIIVSGEGSNYIREWLGQDSNRFRPLDENVKKALRVLGKDKIDLLIWTQGEADKNRTNVDYKLDLNYTLFNQLKRTTWFDAQTPFVATALKTGGDDFQNAVLDDYDTDGNIYTAFVDAGISGGADAIHYDSAGYRTMGALIYTDGLKKIWENTLAETFSHTDYSNYLFSHYQPKDGTNLLVDKVGNNHGLILGNTVVQDGRLIVTVTGADDVSGRVHLSKAHRYSSSQTWSVHFKNTKSRQLSPTLSQGFLLGRYDMGTSGERDYLRLVHTSTYQVIFRNTSQTLVTWTKTEIDAALGSLNMANLHDYSFVADGAGNISLYIDGTLISTKSGMSGGTAFSYNAFAYDSEVEIGETFIFDSAVSATEILKLYTNNDQPVSSTEKATWNAKQDALGFTAENVANKVTSLSGSSTDTQYPSALATYNSIANHNAELTLLQALGSTVKAGNYLAGVFGDSASSLILADGRLHLMAAYLSQPAIISEIGWHQITQGDYTADNYNGVGLFTYSGGTTTLVASSTDDGNIWKAAANTYNKKALSTPYSATAGVYFVGLLYNSSAQVTAPAIARRGTIATNLGSLDLTNSAKIYSYLASSTMPATQAMSGTTASTFAPIIFLH